VRSGASGDSVQAIRIREPKDLDPAIQVILRTLGIIPSEEPRDGSEWRRAPDASLPPIAYRGVERPRTSYVLEIVENYPAVTDEDRVQRRERLSAIKKYAEQLKH
jgi:hypothetical protein